MRYFSAVSGLNREEHTLEDTVDVDDEAVPAEKRHRHYDAFCEGAPPGMKFKPRAQGLEMLQRRKQAHLAVSRTPFLEPLGGSRENFYEQKLLLGLPWYCETAPTTTEEGPSIGAFQGGSGT